MAYTYHELRDMNVTQLREIAKGIEHEAVQGFLTMHKDHLIPAICKALGIDIREHHAIIGLDKAGVKAAIRTLRAKRDKALAEHDSKQLKFVRRQIHQMKRKIHKATI
jgi:hypothetical protein